MEDATPTTSHRRPLPFGERLCGQTLGHRLAKLVDYVFPQPLWRPLGERLGRWAEEEEEASWGLPGSFLGAS